MAENRMVTFIVLGSIIAAIILGIAIIYFSVKNEQYKI